VIFNTHVEILPGDRSISESADDVFDFEVKKKGSTLVVSFDATWFATTGDQFHCQIGIYKGLYAAPTGSVLYIMNSRHWIIGSGTP
jgi:hypothetical protein